jgi:hypothetical protein
MFMKMAKISMDHQFPNIILVATTILFSVNYNVKMPR